MTFPDNISIERQKYIGDCKGFPAGLRNIDKIVTVLDVVLEWSLENVSILEFASSAGKTQNSLGFKKLADNNLLWESYPEGKGSSAKLVFFTRASSYLTNEAEANLRSRFVADLGVARQIKSGAVMELPIKRFATGKQLESLLQFLSWASREPSNFAPQR
jgi:hypothetical protein